VTANSGKARRFILCEKKLEWICSNTSTSLKNLLLVCGVFVKSVGFLSIFTMSTPLHKRKSPLLKTSGDGSEPTENQKNTKTEYKLRGGPVFTFSLPGGDSLSGPHQLHQGRKTFSHCGPVSTWHYFADRPSIKLT